MSFLTGVLGGVAKGVNEQQDENRKMQLAMRKDAFNWWMEKGIPQFEDERKQAENVLRTAQSMEQMLTERYGADYAKQFGSLIKKERVGDLKGALELFGRVIPPTAGAATAGTAAPAPMGGGVATDPVSGVTAATPTDAPAPGLGTPPPAPDAAPAPSWGSRMHSIIFGSTDPAAARMEGLGMAAAAQNLPQERVDQIRSGQRPMDAVVGGAGDVSKINLRMPNAQADLMLALITGKIDRLKNAGEATKAMQNYLQTGDAKAILSFSPNWITKEDEMDFERGTRESVARITADSRETVQQMRNANQRVNLLPNLNQVFQQTGIIYQADMQSDGQGGFIIKGLNDESLRGQIHQHNALASKRYRTINGGGAVGGRLVETPTESVNYVTEFVDLLFKQPQNMAVQALFDEEFGEGAAEKVINNWKNPMGYRK